MTFAADSYVPGSGFLVTKPNPDVKVREGDILLGRGKLDGCSGPILISSTGLGFVSLNFVHHGFGKPESGDALAIVLRDGAVRHRKKLTDLFSEKEIQQFFSTVRQFSGTGEGGLMKSGKRSSWLAARNGRAIRPSSHRSEP